MPNQIEINAKPARHFRAAALITLAAALVGMAGCGKSSSESSQKGAASQKAGGAADEVSVDEDRKRVDYQAELPAAPAPTGEYFQPPSRDEWPDGAFGDAVRRGAAIFRDTPTHAGKYVGNGLACANCHINNGRQPNSAPLWAAWVRYPAYRRKNDHVNSMEERIRGCFTYSMNAQASEAGHPPEPGSPLLTDLQAYMFWLATGAPTGKNMAGRGYPKLDKPAKGYDASRGQAIYEQQCALCHGEAGQGTKLADGRYAFPPLWGKDAYNWGAGMHRVNTAAGFIKANMPLGKPNSLSDQQAWDVAAYINSHERPVDPRFSKSYAKTAETFHKHECYYDKTVDGVALGRGAK